MKLYISAATLQTIQRYGHASLTQVSATPSEHMCVELDARAALATAPEQVGDPVAAIRDRARWFVRDFSREVGFAMSDAQTEAMLNLFLRYAVPQTAGQKLTDELFARVTEWVNANSVPFERQNELFRILAAHTAPPPASTNRLTDEQIRAALAVQWPALYRDGLYTEHDGPKTRAQTAERVEIIRRQYAAIIAATENQP